ncbi:SGNH hydrolase-type esterase domain-containing protein [Polychytrium aggregatum]|uniref:SGNH hydrolase-type esterase domain-containing protein n=1 Tax=Polychytrium aggregatum TaxID=110093 RepID=UPI0022FE006D|nr:SGNH hydrolase-type esterase domain-containing protein [Polychytrium aggregatum]KAI9203858.1 SGNH hydrolase-type esterase domain-containing protein [Polychytrium aggregatum]
MASLLVTILDWVVFLWDQYWIWAKYLWCLLQWYAFESFPNETDAWAKFRQSVTVIGDDIAWGYGDSVGIGQIPGIATYLAKLLSKESSLRQSWRFHNRGYCGSTTRDWLPQSERKPGVKSLQLFDKTFASKKIEESAAVIIALGLNDARPRSGEAPISPEETLENLIAIVRVLRNKGMDVYVSTFPTMGDLKLDGKEVAEQNARRNELVQEWLKNNQTEGVFVGPRLDSSNYEYRHPSLFYRDRYFSLKGYEKFSKDLVEIMLSHLVKREFALFRKHLKM